MGFDNECIVNIQSLAGEYFCPVCRLLVYPNEALQSQCTHLYCKPCLAYVVGTTRACPYDGYLVTEADSKPLTDSDKALAETIGNIPVHCLYHRSGCAWQGKLSECTTHCGGCPYGLSPVVCNRCGTQIVHRQVQEHAQSCPGVQPSAQQAEGTQDATGATVLSTTAEQSQATLQTGASTSQTQTAQVAAAPGSVPGQSQMPNSSQPQVPTPAVPTQEQWYQQQQQYQQYYQQYPGYDPYQQQYQQYNPYPQQAHLQYQQQHFHAQTAQPQGYVQPQPQPQAQPQVRPQLQPQPQPQLQAQPQAQPQASVASQAQVQGQVNMTQQLYPAHPHPQTVPTTFQGHQQPQLYPQAQPHAQQHPSQLQVQPHLQQLPQVPQHQQPHSQMLQPHPFPQPQLQTQPQPQPQLQTQPQPQHQLHVQAQTQAQAQPQPQQSQAQAQPQPQPPSQHPPVHSVSGHQSYPHQQMPAVVAQQHPALMHPQQQVGQQQAPQHTVQMQGHLPPQQLPQMRPPQAHAPMQQQQPPMLPPHVQRPNMLPVQPVNTLAPQPSQQIHQHPGMLPHQQHMAQQQVHGHSLHSQYTGQTPGLIHNQPLQQSPYMQQQAMQSQLHPQAPVTSLQQHAHANQQLQQNIPISHGLPHQSQAITGRPAMPNLVVPQQALQQSSVGPNHAKPTPSTSAQQYPPMMPQPGPGMQSGTKAQVSSVQPGMKPYLQAEVILQKADTKEANVLPSSSSQGAVVEELNTGSVDGGMSMNEDNGKIKLLDSDVKDISESSHLLERDSKNTLDGSDEPVIKQMVKEDSTGVAETKQDKDSIREETHVQDGTQKKPSLEQRDIRKGRNDLSDSQLPHAGSEGAQPFPGTDNGSQAAAFAPHSASDRTSQFTGSERNSMQAVFQERNSFQPQFPQGTGQVQGNSFARPDNQRLPGPPNMQRPPFPDQMLQPSMPLQQVSGQPPVHIRPPSHMLPPHAHPSLATDQFQPPHARQLHCFPHPEVQPGGSVGPGPSGSFGPGPGQFVSQGHHNQGLPHAPGPRIHGDSMGGPPHGPFDAQGGMLARGPLPGPEGHTDHIPLEQQFMKINGGPGKGFSGGFPEPPFPPFNSHDDRFKPFPEERYKRIPEEGFKPPTEDRFNPFTHEPGRHIIDRREFEEDLKQFPRPPHLEAESVSKFESYLSSSRPMGLHMDSTTTRAGSSRILPPYQPGGLRPIGFHEDNMGRKFDPAGVHPDFPRPPSEFGRARMDGLPPIRSPGREFPIIPSSRYGRQEDTEVRESHMFGNAFHESRFPQLPNHLRRGEPDGGPIPFHLRSGDLAGRDMPPGNLRGEPLGHCGFPSQFHKGEGGFSSFPGPANLPMNLHGHSRNMEPGFGSSIPVHVYANDGGFFNAGDKEPFDHSRKRKPGTTGWCRICKVDCETMEGLDMHSQTKEHQKMAMDMVLSIKKSAKKQKLSSDGHISHEDSNKSKKVGLENCGN